MVPRVLAISPPAPGPWTEQLDGLVEAGVDGLVLRLRDAPDALDRLLAHPLPAGLTVLVRPVRPQDVGLARSHGLGVHLPGDGLPAHVRAGGPGLLGQSCHDIAGLRAALAAGCDYALLSPVFPPGSKPGDARPPLGPDGLRRACAAVSLPVLALGGMTADRVAGCVEAGAHGVAGIGAFFSGGHVDLPGAAAVVSALRAAWLHRGVGASPRP